MKPLANWTASERAAWAWPEEQLPSDWVEANVVIPANGFNPEPGSFSFDRTPYWREPINQLANPAVREIWVYKANQIGFTQLMMAATAYCAAQDPGALALLLPDEDSVDELFAEQLKPLIEATPATKRLMTGRAWDSTAHELLLTTMPILGIYSGSAAKLEKRPLRYVIADEVNLLKDLPGEASAVQRALKRITTWQHRGKALFGSKPTTTDGAITRGYESCPDKRRFLMPCPRCGRYHEWMWSQVKGFKDAAGSDKFDRANWIKLNRAAYYECPLCKGRVEETERLGCVRHGRWVSGTTEDDVWSPRQRVSESGKVEGEPVPSDRVGFYAWSIVSPWVTMHQLAAEFVECDGDPDRTRGFRNARLALPYRQIEKAVAPSIVRDKKAIAPPPMLVPKWATAVFTTADVQHGWLRFLTRAWGAGMKSQLMFDGFIREDGAPVEPDKRVAWTWQELHRIGLEVDIPLEGGGFVRPSMMWIDATDPARAGEVYDFAIGRPNVFPIIGTRAGTKLFNIGEAKPGVTRISVSTQDFKHALYGLLHDPDQTKWLPHNRIDEQYILEMSSESYQKMPTGWRWEKNGTARNETWDCEVMQTAMASFHNVSLWPTLADQKQAEERPPMPVVDRNPINAHRGRW